MQTHTHRTLHLGGVIREVAEAKVGNSSAALDRAVARGAVLEVEEEGEKMYYFRINTVGDEESLKEGQVLSRGKATTSKAWDAVSKIIKSLGWEIRVTQKERGIHEVHMTHQI